MSPARISGTAVVDSDARLLTVGQKSELTDSGATALHYHLEPFVVHTEADTFKTTSTGLEVVDSVVVDAPRDGFLSITFSGSQLLDVAEICCPMRLAAKRYIALYGVGIDTTDATTYSVTSSMQDTVYYSLGRIHTPAKVVTGNTVRPVSAGQHTIYFLTRITVVIDADVTSKLQSPSLTVVYFPYESGSFAAPGTYPGESR
jgi:hypothetical protein